MTLVKELIRREVVLTNLAKNRTTETDIRAWLTANGFEWKTGQIFDVELHAIQRPGWLQIFRFRVQVEVNGQQREYFGVVRDDERLRGADKTQVWLFDSEALQEAELAELSEGLIVQGDRSGGYLFFIFLVGVLLLACTAAMFKLLS